MNADFQSLMTLIETETSGPWLNTGGEGGTMTEYLNGVAVSPNGLLSSLKKEEHTGRLKALGVVARKADLNAEVAQQSDLRFVSLTQLEREASKRLAEGRPIVETMKNLAGITQLKYVVVDPKSRDVLIGGPSEAWKYDSNGNPIGREERPTDVATGRSRHCVADVLERWFAELWLLVQSATGRTATTASVRREVEYSRPVGFRRGEGLGQSTSEQARSARHRVVGRAA